MYNLLISLAVGVAVTFLVKLFGFSIWAGLVPGVIAAVGAFIYLTRRVMVQLQKLMGEVQKELGAQPGNPKEAQQAIARAIKMLEGGLVWDKWQFRVASSIHGQIGLLKYMSKDFDGAAKHFAQAHPSDHMSKAFEGALHYQRKEYAKMRASFELAVKRGKKESIIWAVYAWCLTQLKERDEALRVLARAVENNPTDEKLKNSLSALQNDKRLKMKAYEPMWWQFGLETPPPMVMGGRRSHFVRR